MVDPLFFFSARIWSRREAVLRRQVVDIPDDTPATDAVFLVLRRLRLPLVVLVSIFAVSVAGLALIEGVDGDGNPHRLSVFDAFYFMSYTATTIGFGELPHSFTVGQRMWVTASIYSSVIGWAYALGAIFAMLQEPGFRDAMHTERFRRQVARIREPFLLVSGYGHAGRLVTQGLDAWQRPFVVIDGQRSRIELLIGDQLAMDPPAIQGDLTNPSLLGLAGLGSRNCVGVLALTDEDDVNLATVMAVHLLRPDVPVIARCSERATEEHMVDFSPMAVINPYDRFGGYLLVALRRPSTFQLVSWLMGPRGCELPKRREGLAAGRWVVCAEGHLARELVADLAQAGLDVVVADPADGDPDVRGAVGFVAGTELDTANLSLAVHARLANPGLYLVVRQTSHTNSPLVQALDFDSVFMPTDLVARETLARVVSPALWVFLDHALGRPDEWSCALLDRLVEAGGTRSPATRRVDLTRAGAPAVHRWLQAGRPLTLRDLMHDPNDYETVLPLVPLVIVREGTDVVAPGLDEPLARDDSVLFAGRTRSLDDLTELLHYSTVLEYAATGRRLPETWVWRRLTRRSRHRRAGASGDDERTPATR